MRWPLLKIELRQLIRLAVPLAAAQAGTQIIACRSPEIPPQFPLAFRDTGGFQVDLGELREEGVLTRGPNWQWELTKTEG